MKRVFYAVIAMFAIVLVSCSSKGYDQATVDNLIEKINKLSEDQSPSKADYQTGVEQLNYAFDIIEKSGNPEKFAEENEKMAESVSELSFFVMMGEYDENCPESLKKDIKALRKRTEKLGE